MRILTTSEVRDMEEAADAAGHTYDAMMNQAGRSLALAVQQRISVAGKRILILVGPGNNGGDGLVAGRELQKQGADVTAYLARPREESDDAVYRAAVEANVTIHSTDPDSTYELLRKLVESSDVVIDGLLGTGAPPPLRGTIATILQTVNEGLKTLRYAPLTNVHRGIPSHSQPPLIVAVDGPSGLNFDTGEIDKGALKADLTVTFATPKWGHCTLPGASYVGELVIADIGIPDTIALPTGPEMATPDEIAKLLPARPMDAHKGTFGKALIVAGSANYTGAAVLAAKAAVRAGIGLVTLAVPSSLHSAIVPAIPEATYLLLPHNLGVINRHAASLVMENSDGYSAILMGPGLNNTPESKAFVATLLNGSTHHRGTGFVTKDTGDAPSPSARNLPPLVIDADGLNLLTQVPDWPDRIPAMSVLTPHPGEMSRLTGLSTKEIQADRRDIAESWATKWGHVVVLKGAFTVIAAPDHDPVILPFANPGLSSAGTGDVLAGTIVALRAQGLDPFHAALAGAYLHGLAGEIATARYGSAGTVASDVVLALSDAWRRLACNA